MPLRIQSVGERVSFYHIGTRQLRQRGPRKRNKPSMVMKQVSIPSETPYILGAQLCLSRAAVGMRGRSFEEVISNVVENCGGKRYLTAEEIERRRRAAFAKADANIRRMEEKHEALLARITPPRRAALPPAPA